ncbi:MAG: TolB protein, partial [Miltoncostaeaceae bacterium]|nr:TolB protein [Miltoncostaeaceae bacterium]
QLTSAGTSRFPSWSPDGRQIAFTSDRDGDEDIYVMNRDGSAQTRITSSPRSDRYPAFSPDGSRIAFRSSQGAQAIVTMNLDGTDLREVAAGRARDIQPTWQPLRASVAGGAGPAPIARVAAPAGGVPATRAPAARVLISGLRATPARFRTRAAGSVRAGVGTTIRFTLSARARVRLTIRRVGRRGVTASLLRAGSAGSNRVRISGLVRGRPLQGGSYTLTAVAGAGVRASAPASVRLAVRNR